MKQEGGRPAKTRLLFVVPYPELKEKAEFVVRNHPERSRIAVDIRVLTVEEMPEKMDVSAYDAVIARGYSAQKIRQLADQVPVIGLEISSYDIVRAIMECKELTNPGKIAVISPDGPLYEVEAVCGHFGCQARAYMTTRPEELAQVIRQAREEGCDAVIGGYSVNLYAKQEGMPSVVIRTGEDTIRQALGEAVRIVEQIRKEQVVSQTYKTIIYASKEGILYVDSRGIIQVRNRVIREMEGNNSLMHRKLEEVIPFFAEPFREAVATGREVSGKIYTFPQTRITVSAEFTPVVVGRKVAGVVVNVSDITKIQEMEGKIRRKMGEKGLRARYTFDDIIHESAVMEETIAQARRYAASEANVMILGETGTGKELFAQSIHNASQRKNGPFVAINCAALPENLLESELFGYVEGAFTGTAKGGKMGLFEQAHGGTLFLDEIGEISLAIQTKLLRALQEREVRRIGDDKVISVNVRIISATNKNLTRLTGRGDFRRDLMYRLDVLRLLIPPLRKRGQDAWLLFGRLLDSYGADRTGAPAMEPEALAMFRSYPFRGNIRELENVTERIMVLCRGGRISAADMEQILYPRDVEDEELPAEGDDGQSAGTWEREYKKEQPSGVSERELILWGLKQCQGNQSRTAKLLGMDRSTLWRKRQKYGI
ncbi:AAA family ATPase [Clostridium sp. AF18-27]|uniref:sigma 54-interacting transcriptional regulator n=1 Tax=Enterocloster lavalensis TaxID=460384 RepID=UPI000E47FAF0|nr:sigma 54-interacting transcriptional regulator [Enterocloster lavalensis]RHR55171.1 AAA family ATPase [Clostridium sp. AF18-27]